MDADLFHEPSSFERMIWEKIAASLLLSNPLNMAVLFINIKVVNKKVNVRFSGTGAPKYVKRGENWGNEELRIYQRNNLSEKFSPGPGFEPGSPALCSGAITSKLSKRSTRSS